MHQIFCKNMYFVVNTGFPKSCKYLQAIVVVYATYLYSFYSVHTEFRVLNNDHHDVQILSRPGGS